MLLFLLLVTFINYFLLLRRARGIILLVIFIVQGEGVYVYDTLRCLSTEGFRVQQEEGKNPKFVKGLRLSGGLDSRNP